MIHIPYILSQRIASRNINLHSKYRIRNTQVSLISTGRSGHRRVRQAQSVETEI